MHLLSEPPSLSPLGMVFFPHGGQPSPSRGSTRIRRWGSNSFCRRGCLEPAENTMVSQSAKNFGVSTKKVELRSKQHRATCISWWTFKVNKICQISWYYGTVDTTWIPLLYSKASQLVQHPVHSTVSSTGLETGLQQVEFTCVFYCICFCCSKVNMKFFGDVFLTDWFHKSPKGERWNMPGFLVSQCKSLNLILPQA